MNSRNLLDEFTGVNGIPPAGVTGRGVPTNPKLRLKRRKPRCVIDSFIGVSPADALAEDDAPAPDHGAEPVTPAPMAPAPVAATQVIVEPQAPAEATPVAPATTPPSPPAPSVPAAPAVESADRALIVSKEVVEALSAGRSVVVRGILLEPAFKAVTPATPSAAAMRPMAESAAAAMFPSGIAESAGEPVDMNAPQPAPAPSTNGKAVASAFRRFGGASVGS